MNRRTFIQNTGIAGFFTMAGGFPLSAMPVSDVIKLTILHTNDVHSRIDPFPDDGSRNAGKGGAARRAAMIKQIRAEEDNVLLFDSGDMFQGTPYFNMFGGELEFKLMSEMGYDAATIGNHDFDAGIDGLAKQLRHADFPLITSNYDMDDTVMSGKYRTHKIFDVEGVRIGVFGLGIELDGLVPKSLYTNTVYLDPVSQAREMTKLLRDELACDYVICLSHLGFRYRHSQVSDVSLAENTEGIDLILGGHTHTFLDEAAEVINRKGAKVYINQVGWAGMRLGRIDVFFERFGRRDNCVVCKNMDVG